MMEFDLAGTREWGEKAIDLAERLGETEVLVAATRNVGTVELSHGLAEGREKLQRSLAARARRGAGEPRGGRLLQPRVLLARHARLRDGGGASRGRPRVLRRARPARLGHVPGRLGGAHRARPRPLGRGGGARRREPRAHARLAAAQPVPLAARRRRAARPPRRRRTRGRRSTRRWPSPSRRTSWTRSAPWPSRGRRRAGSRARPAGRGRRPTTRWRAPSPATIAG